MKQGTLRIEKSQSKLILTVVISLITTGLFLFFIISGHKIGDYLVIILGTIGCFGFGVCSIYFIICLFKSGPSIETNHKGIIVYVGLHSSSIIEWQDIEDLNFRNLGVTSYLRIYLKDNNKYIRSTGDPIFKLMRYLHALLLGSPIILTRYFYKTILPELKISLEDAMAFHGYPINEVN